jgi:hypothetical protein
MGTKKILLKNKKVTESSTKLRRHMPFSCYFAYFVVSVLPFLFHHGLNDHRQGPYI